MADYTITFARPARRELEICLPIPPTEFWKKLKCWLKARDSQAPSNFTERKISGGFALEISGWFIR
jgi:hypothetical protein